MSKSGIITSLAVAAALAIGGSTSATAAETWKIATKLPADSLEGRGFQRFADLVGEYTKGEIVIEIFPTEQLGKTEATLEQLGAGIIQVYAEGPDYLNKWAPEMAFVFAPFVFESRDHWLRFMRTDLVKGWMDRVESEGGVTVIGEVTEFPRGPYRVMASKKPVSTLEDVQGLKIRMFPNDVAVGAYTALGTEVRVLGWTEVYESLGRGIVEAVTLPISLVETMRFYEQGATNVAKIDEFHQSVAFMVNAAAYNGLTPEVRAAVNRAFSEAAVYEAEIVAEEVDAAIARLEAQGVEFVQANVSEFVERASSYYQEQEAAGKLPEGFMAAVDATR